jgi:hypothetical protein
MSVVPEKIRITDFRIHRFGVYQLSPEKEGVNTKNSLGIGLDHEIIGEEKMLKFLFDIKLGINAEDDTPIHEAEFKCEFAMLIENLEDFKKEVEGETKFDLIIGLTCTGIAYSTLRGILFSKLMGTPFDGLMLPVVDPKSLMKP